MKVGGRSVLFSWISLLAVSWDMYSFSPAWQGLYQLSCLPKLLQAVLLTFCVKCICCFYHHYNIPNTKQCKRRRVCLGSKCHGRGGMTAGAPCMVVRTCSMICSLWRNQEAEAVGRNWSNLAFTSSPAIQSLAASPHTQKVPHPPKATTQFRTQHSNR